MTAANDSITVTPGTGATVATHIPAGASKEYQVVMLADATGQVEGSQPSYWMTVNDQTVAASKIYFDLWNGSASNVLHINGIWIVPGQDVTVAFAVAPRLDYYRTSAVGTGGTASTYNSATAPTAGGTQINITPKDSANAALPSGVSARMNSTTATASSWLYSLYAITDEGKDAWGAYAQQYYNAMPEARRGLQEFILRPSEGLRVSQNTIAGAGSIGFLVEFSIE